MYKKKKNKSKNKTNTIVCKKPNKKKKFGFTNEELELIYKKAVLGRVMCYVVE